MPLYRDDAIILRTHKLGEADRIVTMLTRRYGKVRAVAKGVRRTTSRIGSRMEPFMLVDVQAVRGSQPRHRESGRNQGALRAAHRRGLCAVHRRDRDGGDG
ncbi:hypothetical protein GCM10025876_04010 [Demequina litorisediminis]|uniref:DNA replication/recombination mediator RecO N-terminal domain-containing protein n=1 Tax=Demequina litorisediminis TaxID=1849022 RepID=A0ABQ6I8P5_9MICO|nr:hypothetical protein GCM10025876_04010 [Demequina litorisediminis]